ncbi:hypothetical protein N791_13095 [Lysobacter defluvii IMMIB APB-9 = DSM 18482]|uniref:PepSY domain-containing protein n=1 Tax=Lysobacter defluvii IMMIB APB-9 = DSM 18482 TaxID=1385515 RepID=A0A0A0MA59_9GAMM|nr:hypothetical protein N791_13095 [Lysobacter defluvii IMMIB APB-9 = DSM 18482]
MVLIAGTAGDAWAQRTRDKARESNRELIRRAPVGASDHGPRRATGSRNQRELSEAVRRVERRTGGQVLSAELVPFDGRTISRIKVVDSAGRVRVYLDDGTSRRLRSDDN